MGFWRYITLCVLLCGISTQLGICIILEHPVRHVVGLYVAAMVVVAWFFPVPPKKVTP